MSANGPTALPTFWEVAAPSDWTSIEFISDLHLDESTPKTFDALASYLSSTTADAVYILGDLFEVWVGDDSRHEGFEARCADLLSEAASRLTLGFMSGNRDFLVGADMLRACGLMALSDPTVMIAFGQRVMLTHGDALCLSDLDYQRFRSQVRNPAWRADFLSRPLTERRKAARHIREESERRKREQVVGQYFDVDTATAVRWMHEAGTPLLIHGHTHRPESDELAPGFDRHVLSDWDVDHATPPRAQVLRWDQGGLTRLTLA
jgi:UDP-2,3-diacylglucosamine hydrolase